MLRQNTGTQGFPAPEPAIPVPKPWTCAQVSQAGPDGMGMNVAGHEKVKEAAAYLDISAEEFVQAKRGNAGHFGGLATAGRKMPTATAASALATRGVRRPKQGSWFVKTPDAVRLGAKIGLAVMGPVAWKRYITTSTTAMSMGEKPLNQCESNKLAKEQCSREGWVLHDATHSESKWTMEDNITLALPGHTEENPVLHVESMRKAIFETHHVNWKRHITAQLADKKDDDDGMKLSRKPTGQKSRAKGGSQGATDKG